MKTTGAIVLRDTAPSGPTSGVVYGQTGPKGGACADPAVAFSYQLRRRLRPIRVPECIITDAAGRPIAAITVDPVTGRRTRRELPVMARTPRRPCALLTGAWVRAADGHYTWTGEQGRERVRCGYVGEVPQLLCHMIATHQLTLGAARSILAARGNLVEHEMEMETSDGRPSRHHA